MEAAIFARRYPGKEVGSAGVSAADGEEASPDAVIEMSKRGLDVSRHRTRSIGSCDLSQYDVVACMTTSHAESLERSGAAVLTLGEWAGTGQDVDDPAGRGQDAYEKAAHRLTALIDSLGPAGGSPRAPTSKPHQ